jgi:hypothetical protein
MEYIKNNKGINKTILVKDSEENDLRVLEDLSLDTDIKVYLVPESTEVVLNEDGWIVSTKGDRKNIWQFIKGWAMPYECAVNSFPFAFKMKEMWDSDKETQEVNIDQLKWNLEFPWWETYEGVPYNLSPKEVLADIDKYPIHKDRINNADMSYPLILVQTKQNRWLIFDGMHRFLKEILDGKKTVSCQKFTIKEMEEYIPDSHMKYFKEWVDLEYK